jgi:pimeloyl-ACP methyl ester carboxylesterase
VVEIPDAGHMPFFENPEPSFTAALTFLDAAAPVAR